MGEQVAARLIWGCSSVGRAPALQAGGQEFESLHLHLIIQRAAAGLTEELFRVLRLRSSEKHYFL